MPQTPHIPSSRVCWWRPRWWRSRIMTPGHTLLQPPVHTQMNNHLKHSFLGSQIQELRKPTDGPRIGDLHHPSWAGWVSVHSAWSYTKKCLCVQGWEDEGFHINGNYLIRHPWGVLGPPSFGGCAIGSGPCAVALAMSAVEPEEALWRWSHSSAQPTCWNFPEILHCRHFPRRYANGIRKNQLSLRNRGMRRAVNATRWVIGWLLAGDLSASHPYIILMNFYGMPPLCLLPPPAPTPVAGGRRFMACSFSVDWMQLALLQQRTNRYICFTGWEEWVWRNCTSTSLCNKGTLKNADIVYGMTLTLLGCP